VAVRGIAGGAAERDALLCRWVSADRVCDGGSRREPLAHSLAVGRCGWCVLKEVSRPLVERLSRVEPRCRAWHAAERSRELPRLLAGFAGSETGRAGALLVPGLDRRSLPDNSLWSEASIESSCGAVFPERSSRRKCGTGTATG
jgi:hypothetical protein